MQLKESEKEGSTGWLKFFYLKNKKSVKRGFLFFALISLLISGKIVSNKVIKKGYSGLFDFVGTVVSNYRSSWDANPENVSIEIKEKDFKELEKNRNRALERGVIINDLDGDYVSGTIEYQGKKISVKLRLKGHMTDHLQDNKWSFRIKVKEKDQTFMGMKRFSIQHPGTRGYIYEWIYHELMKREDVIALRYKFINVTVNGRDWGIYAVEENFENELIENNERIKGPMVRFNPDLYWINRYNADKRVASVDEFASYYSANVEAYREDKLLKDSLQKQYYMKAVSLIDGLRSRKIKVSEAFDITRLAKFHAIVELVGGMHSIDWSDIKYYYNPVSQKLEPVAYESFTELNSRTMSSQYKYVSIDSGENYEDWHSMIFSDPQFFATYMKNVERLTQKKYLDDFFADSRPELNANLAILYKEFPYKKFDKVEYYKRQQNILRALNTPKAIHAYFKGVEGSKLCLQLGAIDALPVEIGSLNVAGVRVKPMDRMILAGKQHGEFVLYKDCFFQIPEGLLLNDSSAGGMELNYSILGSSLVKKAKVFLFPHIDDEFIAESQKNKHGNVVDFPFLIVDEQSKSIIVKEGAHTLSSDLIIPPGYKWMANSFVSIDLKNSAKIISYSPLVFTGTEDAQIVIQSSDFSSQGLELISAGKSIFENVVFKNLPKIRDSLWKRSGALTFYESDVTFKQCSFYNCKAENAVSLIRSNFVFRECLFNTMSDDAIDADFSTGQLDHCVFEECKENALDVSMSKISLNSIYINGARNKAFNVKAGAQIRGTDLKIKNAYIGISAEDLSSIDFQNVSISDSEIGVVAYKNKPDGGHPTIDLNKVVFKNVSTNCLKEKKSLIRIDGQEFVKEMKNVEEIVKGEKKKR